MKNNRKIRVGLIRMDTHTMYFGVLMGEHDWRMLRGPVRPLENRNHSWQVGGTHYYFYTNYGNPSKMTVPGVEGFQITRIWDANPDVAEDAAKVFFGKPKICDSFEEVSDDVDLVVIGDCNGDGSDHLKLATPSIEKGVPTYVDKPFAYTLKDARAIVALAQKHKTPVLSLSIMRVVPQLEQFRARFAEVGEPLFGTTRGCGVEIAGLIHDISTAQCLFGPGVESVECMGQTPMLFTHLSYGGKPGKPPQGFLLEGDHGDSYQGALYASVYGRLGAIHSPGIGDFEFPFGAARIIEKAKEMVQTGKPPVPYDEMLENIAVIEAIRVALKTGKRVAIKDVM